jgi:diacylglycerol kinase family enzyme
MLIASLITSEIVKSQASGHIIELVRDLKLDDYDEIVGLGGDGTLFEIGIFISNF